MGRKPKTEPTPTGTGSTIDNNFAKQNTSGAVVDGLKKAKDVRKTDMKTFGTSKGKAIESTITKRDPLTRSPVKVDKIKRDHKREKNLSKADTKASYSMPPKEVKYKKSLKANSPKEKNKGKGKTSEKERNGLSSKVDGIKTSKNIRRVGERRTSRTSYAGSNVVSSTITGSTVGGSNIRTSKERASSVGRTSISPKTEHFSRANSDGGSVVPSFLLEKKPSRSGDVNNLKLNPEKKEIMNATQSKLDLRILANPFKSECAKISSTNLGDIIAKSLLLHDEKVKKSGNIEKKDFKKTDIFKQYYVCPDDDEAKAIKDGKMVKRSKEDQNMEDAKNDKEVSESKNPKEDIEPKDANNLKESKIIKDDQKLIKFSSVSKQGSKDDPTLIKFSGVSKQESKDGKDSKESKEENKLTNLSIVVKQESKEGNPPKGNIAVKTEGITNYKESKTERDSKTPTSIKEFMKTKESANSSFQMKENNLIRDQTPKDISVNVKEASPNSDASKEIDKLEKLALILKAMTIKFASNNSKKSSSIKEILENLEMYANLTDSEKDEKNESETKANMKVQEKIQGKIFTNTNSETKENASPSEKKLKDETTSVKATSIKSDSPKLTAKIENLSFFLGAHKTDVPATQPETQAEVSPAEEANQIKNTNSIKLSEEKVENEIEKKNQEIPLKNDEITRKAETPLNIEKKNTVPKTPRNTELLKTASSSGKNRNNKIKLLDAKDIPTVRLTDSYTRTEQQKMFNRYETSENTKKSSPKSKSKTKSAKKSKFKTKEEETIYFQSMILARERQLKERKKNENFS